MAGIQTLLTEIETELRAIHPQLEASTGANHIGRHGTPPRIVWVVTTVAHAAAEKPKLAQGRSVLTRQIEVNAHVWGADLGSLEQLIDDTIVAIHHAAHGSVDFAGEDWIAAEEAHQGQAALLRFHLAMPVVEARRTNRNPPLSLEADITSSVQGDRALDWKEP